MLQTVIPLVVPGRKPLVALGIAVGLLLCPAGVRPAVGADAPECLLVPGLVKAGPDVNLRDYGQPALVLHAAGNEYELFQVVFRNPTGQPLRGAVTLRWRSRKLAGITCRWYREEWIKVDTPSDAKSRPGAYPDPLVPLTDGHLEVNQGLTILMGEIHVPRGCPPGKYHGRVEATCGRRTFRFPATLTVWGFSLPETTTLKTAFGMDFQSIMEKEGVEPGQRGVNAVLMGYYDLLAEHRVSPISIYPEPVLVHRENLPPKLDVTHCDAIWHYCYDQLHFNTLRVPFDESAPVKEQLFSEDYNRKCRDYLKAFTAYLWKNGWLDRAYIYISTVDEPATPEAYAKSRDFYRLVKAADNRLRYRHGEQIQLQEENIRECDILDVNLLTFQRHRSELSQLQDKEIGWYPAVGPKGDYPTYFTDRPSLEPRILCLMNYGFNVPRLLYWNICWWRQVQDPYREALTYHAPPDLFANGDGSLVYPGRPQGMIFPVASLRLKMIRDGIEDYEYCRLLEKKQGRDFVMKLLGMPFRDLTDFSRDVRDHERLRLRLGEALDRARP